MRDADEIERGIAAFAHGSNDGLIMAGPGSSAQVHRELIIRLAAQHRLPAVYPGTRWVTFGGLISYGPNSIDQYRRAAGYVDRILKGEKPADLPVQEAKISTPVLSALGFPELAVRPTLVDRKHYSR